MAAASSNPTLQTTEQRSTSSGSKRNATHEQGGEASPSQGPPRASKRSRTAVHAAVGHHEQSGNRSSGNDDGDDDHDQGRDDAAGDYGHLPPLSKHATEKEKEARRMARMIRNRNAAQASRDRKKEHTAFLERRVAQLEALLRQARRPAPAAQPNYSIASPAGGAGTVPLPPLPGSRLRATSVSSTTSSSEDAGRIADLEDENESLRAQLEIEQAEKAQLLTRLELVEEKLARLTTPDAGPISFSPFSGTSTPLPAYEPTFAFNTPDIKPLPQPEERAFVEERERQRRRTSQVSFEHIAPLGPPFSLDPPSTTSPPIETQPNDRTGTSRLVAAEVTGPCSPAASLSTFRLEALPVAVVVPPSTPSLSSSASSSSAAGSVPGLELDIASTPEPAAESYLDLHELDVSPEWSAWAKAVEPSLDSRADPLESGPQPHDDESALTYLNWSAFHDASMMTTTAGDGPSDRA